MRSERLTSRDYERLLRLLALLPPGADEEQARRLLRLLGLRVAEVQDREPSTDSGGC